MALPYQPKPRAVLSCDFFGYIAPEIVKRRPVVVLKAHKTHSKLVVVVPLSTTRPNPVERHHYRLLHNPLATSAAIEVWAKCDIVAVVSTERLDLIPSGRRRPDGRREYLNLQISQEQFDAIRQCVIAGLGLGTTLSQEPVC